MGIRGRSNGRGEAKRDGAGLQYMRNWVYDPSTGRFTQEDPIGLAGGLNAYGFPNGDPVNFSDPFGLFDRSLKEWRDCEFGSLTGGFGFTGIGVKGTLGPLKAEGTVLSGGVEGEVTATATGTKTSAKTKITLLSGSAGVGKYSAKGSLDCSLGTGGFGCSSKGSLGEDIEASSNGTIGAELKLGVGRLGGTWDVVGTGKIVAGSTIELLTMVSKAAWKLISRGITP